jgi:CubicO group peptidase (beta-lactamase class C family)
MRSFKRVKRLFRIAACAVLSFLVLARGISPAEAQDLDDKTISAIDGFIADKMQELNIPGMALGIVHGDQIVYLKGYGVADSSGRAVTAQTPFQLASLSKSFTGLALMQQVEAGKIDLDAPVKQYIPWFRPQDTEHPITVSELLYHTSGIPSYPAVESLFGHDESDGALESEVRRLSAGDLDHPAGESYGYSNGNYNIAGYLVQIISGQSYEDYIREHILVPLDMRHSFLSYEEARADGLSSVYYPFFGIPIVYDDPFARGSAPSARILSSAEDMAHYLIAHLNEGRYGDVSILSADGITKLHTPGVELNHWAGYAVGWNVFPLWDTSVTELDGLDISIPIVLQHEGSAPYRTNMLLVPKEGWGVVTLVNTSNVAIQSAFNSIGFGITELLMGFPPPPTSIDEDFLTQHILLVCTVLVLMQVLRLIGSIANLRHWRRFPELRPRSAFQLAKFVLLPALIDLALVVWFFVGLPYQYRNQYRATLFDAIRAAPDVGLLVIIVLVLAMVWGILRTVLYFKTLRRKPSVATSPAVA